MFGEPFMAFNSVETLRLVYRSTTEDTMYSYTMKKIFFKTFMGLLKLVLNIRLKKNNCPILWIHLH